MSVPKTHYCFTLSEEQLKFLRSKKYKVDRMECFMSLATLAVREPKLEQVSKTQQVEILPGQFMVDNTQLAKLWDKDRKTVPKILEAMESLDISSSQKVGENRLFTLHSLSGWYVDGMFVPNPFTVKRNYDGSGTFHKDVPPAKVIVIDDDTVKDVNGDESVSDGGNFLDNYKSKTSPSAIQESLSLSQSNDSVGEGKSCDDGKLSDGSDDTTSPDTDDVPNSTDNTFVQDADGKRNVGKRNESQTQLSGEQMPQTNVKAKPSDNGNDSDQNHL